MSITTDGSVCLQEIDEMVRDTLKKHRVSPVTGFLAENPLTSLPTYTINRERDALFADINSAMVDITSLIKERKVLERVKEWPCGVFLGDLYWKEANLLHLCLSMLAHAGLREAYPYAKVGELMKDDSMKHLCREIAVPLWEVSKITGADPTMAYGFYSLRNGAWVNPEEPFALYNFKLLHSFTGGESEKWFVGIHQVIEVAFAPAIPEYLRAYFLAKLLPRPDVVSALEDALTKTAVACEKCVDVLRAMRAHLDPREYFESVRLYYMFPRNVIFDGVEELKGKPQNPYGETGGQAPLQHLRLAALGIYPHEDKYFPMMRRNMQTPFRDLIEMMFDSRVRDFVLRELNKRKCADRNVALAKAYNRNVNAILNFRIEHRSLVHSSIQDFGDSHGTGKPPLTFLDDQIERTKRALIPLP